ARRTRGGGMSSGRSRTAPRSSQPSPRWTCSPRWARSGSSGSRSRSTSPSSVSRPPRCSLPTDGIVRLSEKDRTREPIQCWVGLGNEEVEPRGAERMAIDVSLVPSEEVRSLRDLHRAEMGCQIVLDSWHGRGWTDSYLFRREGRVIGYGLVGGVGTDPRDI